MVSKNPYSQYTNNKVFTASKEELTLILYDGALKFANQAIVSIEQKDMIKANNLIIKVQEIIREFQVTLDRSYEISANLADIYEYLYNRLVEANSKKDKAMLEEVRDFIRDLRDTWKEAMALAKKDKAV